MSLRAFAPLAGVSQPVLSKGIKNGRLAEAIGYDRKGRPYIANPALALAEFRANAAQAPNNGGSPPKPAPVAPPLDGPSLAQAQREVALERARALALTNRHKERRLIDRAEEERRDFERARTVREAVLAVPDRVASELAAEANRDRVYARLDEELRLALEALADVFEAEQEGGGDADPRGRAPVHHAG